MRMDKFTTMFQMALADAQSLAIGRDHQYVEPLLHYFLNLGNMRQFQVCGLFIKGYLNPGGIGSPIPSSP